MLYSYNFGKFKMGFVCPVCELCFVNNISVYGTFRDHIKNFHGVSLNNITTIKCSDCEIYYSSYRAFEVHMRSKHPPEANPPIPVKHVNDLTLESNYLEQHQEQVEPSEESFDEMKYITQFIHELTAKNTLTFSNLKFTVDAVQILVNEINLVHKRKLEKILLDAAIQDSTVQNILQLFPEVTKYNTNEIIRNIKSTHTFVNPKELYLGLNPFVLPL